MKTKQAAENQKRRDEARDRVQIGVWNARNELDWALLQGDSALRGDERRALESLRDRAAALERKLKSRYAPRTTAR